MTTETIQRLKADIQAARDRGDLQQVARLRFRLPLSERQEPVIAARRGNRAPAVGLRYDSTTETPTQSSTRSTAAYTPTVTIEDGAWRQLDNDHFDGRESGGYLFGPVDSPDVVAYAVIAAIDDENRTGRSVRLDRDKAHEIWQSMPPDMTIRGSFHCHPRGTHAQASAVDISGAQGQAQAYGRPWIELVLHDKPTTVLGMNGRHHESSTLEIGATIFRPDGSYVQAQVERSY